MKFPNYVNELSIYNSTWENKKKYKINSFYKIIFSKIRI